MNRAGRTKGLRGPLLALAAGIAVLALVLTITAKRGRESAPAYAFDPSIATRIVGLDIVLDPDSVSLARRDDGRWVIAPDGVPADSARVAAVLEGLARLSTEEPAALNPDHARLLGFGLAPENAKRVTMRLDDGTRARVLIGHTAEIDFASSYWKYPDRPEVHRTPGEIALDAASRSDMWRVEAGYGAPEVPDAVEMPLIPESGDSLPDVEGGASAPRHP